MYSPTDEYYWSPPSSTNSTTLLYPSVTPQFSPNRRKSDSYPECWLPSSPPYALTDKRKASILPIRLTIPKFDSPKPRTIVKGFERPDLRQLALHVLVCLVSYPAMYLVTLVANERSLFLVRILVAVWSALVGFCLALSLAAFATKHLEAASKPRYIHCGGFF